MINRLSLLIFCCSLCSFVFGRANLLDRKISIEIRSTPVKTILGAIEEKAEVQFSYNPVLVNEDRIVSLSIQNETISFGLSLLFEGDIRFKEVGNHIVLLQNESEKVIRQRKRANLSIVFRGKVIDKRTQLPVKNVSIYDVESRYATITNSLGEYTLEIPKTEAVRSLYVRKKGFKEFVFVVDATADSVVLTNVALEPLPVLVDKIETNDVRPIYQPIEEEALSGIFVSYETYIHGENLEEIKETRMAQISLVPSVSIGSNLSTNGLITNNFSLNVLGGYSNGIEGAEIGGILNIVKGDARWFQAGGIYNMVGGDFDGVQMGGISNSVIGSYRGVQFSGIAARDGGSFVGGQFSGIGAIVAGDYLGAQFTGIAGKINGNLTGLQCSGILSVTKQSVLGGQISGISGVIRGKLDGLQIGGISSIVYMESNGFQLSGITNRANEGISGGQISGISNRSKGGTNIIQLAGISNSADFNTGLQLGGIFNYSRMNNGLQIGLINVSENGKGIALGLINFSLKGYHKTEIEANEVFPLNLTFKSGVRHFYNNYAISIAFLNNRPVYVPGFGFGSACSMSDKLGLNFDLTAHATIDTRFDKFATAQFYKFSPTIDFKLANWVSVFAGPSINANVTYHNGTSTDLAELSFSPVFKDVGETVTTQIWVGGKIGFRF